MQKMLEPSLGVNIMLDQYYVVWEKKSNNIIKTEREKKKYKYFKPLDECISNKTIFLISKIKDKNRL